MPKEIKLEHKGIVKHVIQDDRAKGITVRLVLAWIFSVIFFLGGILHLSNGLYVGGLLFFLAGLVVFPPLDKAMRNNWNFYLSGWLKFFIVIILLSLSSASGNLQNNNPAGASVSTQNDIVANIAPKQQTIQNVTIFFYSQEDAINAIAEAKGMADKPDQQTIFRGKYDVWNEGNAMRIVTPYLLAVSSVTDKIEKYDEYTLEDTIEFLNLNLVGAVGVFRTEKMFYQTESISLGNQDDIRAVIEFDGDKICRGGIDSAVSEYKGLDGGNQKFPYQTTLQVKFPCFSDVRNKTVNFVYVLGSQKFRFDNVDMSKFK